MSKRQNTSSNILNYFSKKAKTNNDARLTTTEPEMNISVPNDQINVDVTNKNDDNHNLSLSFNKFDIANYIGVKLTNSEKKNIFENLYVPPVTFDYPTSGSRNLKFQSKWLKDFHWLTYSKQVDGAFCKYCVLFMPDSNVGFGRHQKVGKLCIEKFRTWKDALEVFRNHSKTKYHDHNFACGLNILKIEKGEEISIINKIDKESQKQILENRNKLKPIIDAVLFCGRQNIALRGHRDHGKIDIENEANEGNFKELLKFQCKQNHQLQEILSHSQNNSLYTSWKIQNEIIQACNDLILEKLVNTINTSKFLSILVDETTDISCVQQMSLCVRCLDLASPEPKVQELFLQFVPVEDCTGKGLQEKIIKSCLDLGLDLDLLRGQGYDGAAVMSGKFNGVQAHIKKVYPQALYVHCVAHSLNLAVSNSCEIPEVRNSLGVIGELYNFFNTPKRHAVLKNILEREKASTSHEKLLRLCATRWTEKHHSVEVFVELYDYVLMALEEISCWDDNKTANLANQLNCSVRKTEFIVSLVCINQVFLYTSKLNRILQTKNIDLKKAVHLADDTQHLIKELRNNAESEFEKLFEVCEKKHKKFEFELKKPRTTATQRNRCNVIVNSVKEYYRICIYIPLLDSFISNIQQRFTEHKDVLSGFQCLLPENPEKLSEETLQEFESLANFYKNDIKGSLAEVKVELKFWYLSLCKLEQKPRCALTALTYINEGLPNIKSLLQILAILPVSTAETERSFSTLKRLKTYLRNSSSESRLNGLALLHIYREATPTSDLIINKLAEKPRRLDFKL